MMEKYALFAFNGEARCFIHVLLNGLDLAARGHEVKIVIEGAACRLVPELGETVNPFYQHYSKARDKGPDRGNLPGRRPEHGQPGSGPDAGPDYSGGHVGARRHGAFYTGRIPDHHLLTASLGGLAGGVPGARSTKPEPEGTAAAP